MAPVSILEVAVAEMGGHAIPSIVMFFIWLVLVILLIIGLAALVHWAGGGLLHLSIGHFTLRLGFT